jgi:hypothetical protein
MQQVKRRSRPASRAAAPCHNLAVGLDHDRRHAVDVAEIRRLDAVAVECGVERAVGVVTDEGEVGLTATCGDDLAVGLDRDGTDPGSGVATRLAMRRALPLVLASALLLVVTLAASPVDATAKPSTILVSNSPINVTVSSPPAGHGSTFPVTVSGNLVYQNTRLNGTKLKKGSKLAKSARPKCPVGGRTVPVVVSVFDAASGTASVRGIGSPVTDSSGAFSAVVQVDGGASAGVPPNYIAGGVPIAGYPGLSVKTAVRIGGHPVYCYISANGLVAAS